jgi:hypothetical protein
VHSNLPIAQLRQLSVIWLLENKMCCARIAGSINGGQEIIDNHITTVQAVMGHEAGQRQEVGTVSVSAIDMQQPNS